MKKKIKIPIIDAEIIVVKAKTIKDGLILAGLVNEEDKGELALCFHIHSRTISLIFPEEVTTGLIVHECKHALNFLFEDIRHQLDTNNDELECYFLQYIFEQVNKTLNVKN